jgi:putative ABC transport system permease protein
VGVMPPGFHYPDQIDIWQRLRWDLTQHSRSAHFMESVLRLADGTTLDQAASAADTLALRLQQDFPQSNRAMGVRLTPLIDEQLGYYRPALIVLFGAVGLLLVIACLNVASLLLTRALTREREIAVRIALGASPRQLVTQLFTESLVLSSAGALTGLAVAAAALPLIVTLSPVQIPRLDEASVNLRALALGSTLVVTTTVLFGLVPALALVTRQVTTRLKSAERSVSRGPRRVYSILVAGEVALACAMLVSAALLVRTVSRMMDTPTGVDADDVVIASVQMPGDVYPSWPRVEEAHASLLATLREQPGVLSAGAGNFLPFEVGWRVPFAIDGEPPPARPEDAPQAQYHSVSDGYFETMGAARASGRTFAATDTSRTVPVVVVNATFERRFLAGRAVGRAITTTATGIGPLGANLMRPPRPSSGQAQGPPPPMRFEIVGVVEDVRNAPLGQAVEPALYFSTRQFPFRELFLSVRARDRETAMAGVRRALAARAPGVPVGAVQTWGERFASRTAQARLLMAILVGFGALAALLAALGVYGLFSWSVALRRRELAIRLTLGARPLGIGRLVVRHGLVLVGSGLLAGVGIIRIAEGLLTRVLYEVSPADPGSTVAALGLLVGAAMLACVPPAFRAMRIDPVEGLRAE